MLNNLKYIEEHKVCNNYYPESHTTFKIANVNQGGQIDLGNFEYNHLIFILKGRLNIEYDDFAQGAFGSEEVVFLPSYSRSNITVIEECKIIVGTFEFPSDVCNSKFMESYWHLKSKTEYQFASVPIKPEMKKFLDLMMTYHNNGINCSHLHEIKQKEVFLVFRWFYSKEEYVRLFHSIIGKSLDFRSAVVKNYTKAKNVEELASIIGMSRSNFDTKFKESFGMPAKQWIMKRTARSIRYYISKPGVTISEVMVKYNFDSFSHFNRFCKQQFGMSPTELVKTFRSK